jgi:hypothetical protein
MFPSQGFRNSPSLGSWLEIVTIPLPSLFCDVSRSVKVVPGRLNVIREVTIDVLLSETMVQESIFVEANFDLFPFNNYLASLLSKITF